MRYCGNYGSNFSAVMIDICKISSQLWSNWVDFGTGTRSLRGTAQIFERGLGVIHSPVEKLGEWFAPSITTKDVARRRARIVARLGVSPRKNAGWQPALRVDYWQLYVAGLIWIVIDALRRFLVVAWLCPEDIWDEGLWVAVVEREPAGLDLYHYSVAW